MTMNQMPSSVARALTDDDGTETTTMPAMRLTRPKPMAQPADALGAAHDAAHEGDDALDDPHHADEEADGRLGEVEVSDHHDTDDDLEQAGDRHPGPVLLVVVEGTDEVEDPAEDQEGADEDADHAQRGGRVEGQGQTESEGDDAHDQLDLPDHFARYPALHHHDFVLCRHPGSFRCGKPAGSTVVVASSRRGDLRRARTPTGRRDDGSRRYQGRPSPEVRSSV